MRRVVLLLIFALSFVTTGFGQHTSPALDTPNVFSNTNRFALGALFGPKTFATLPSETDGKLIYCVDCQKVDPCTAGGTGAFAYGVNGAWSCSASSSSGGGGLSDPGYNGIVKRTGFNITGLASFSDITSLFGSGSCFGYIKSDGTCSTSANATQIQGKDVDATAPTKGQGQVFDDVANKYRPQSKSVIDVRDYGAIADGEVATDCYMTASSAVLTCETAHFAAGDVGKKIVAYGNGPTGNGYWQPLSSSIITFTSATQVTLNDVAIQSTQHTKATISSATRAGDAGSAISTYNATNHGLSAGQVVNIVMTQNADQTYSGLEPIDTVPGANSFTVRTLFLPMVAGTGGGTADGHSYRVVWGTDNTTALQAAVDAAATAGGGTVHFPGAVAGTGWTGHYLTHGINLPCPAIGTFASGTCTLAYNNISLIGDGIGTTKLELWDTTVNTTTFPALIALSQKANGIYDFVPPGPLKNIEVCCMSLYGLGNTAQKVLGEPSGPSDGVHIHDLYMTGGKSEGLYQGGKSLNWEVDHIRGSILGSPINASLGLSALNANGSYGRWHDNYIDNSGQCMEGAGHDNAFYNNRCNGAGTWTTQAGGMLCVNLSSATYGMWNWKFYGNTFIGCNTSGANVIGQQSNVYFDNNTMIDSGVQIGTGKETNNVIYGPQQQFIHGTSTVSKNNFINDGMSYPATQLIKSSNGGGSIPFLESFVVDRNTFTYERGYCSTSPHIACDRDADCTAGQCYVPDLIYGNSLSFGGAKWLPATSYAGANVAVVSPSLDNSYVYMNKGATGTSGATEPTWCITAGCTVADNTVTWTIYGHRPTLTISNTTVNTPQGIPSAGALGLQYEIALANSSGTSRKAVSIQNFQSTAASTFQLGVGTGGQNDAGFINETIPAGKVASDDRRFSDTLPTSGYWAVGQKITKVTPASGTSPGWTVTRTGYYGTGWVANTTCTYGDFVTAVPDDAHVFRAINASPGTTSNPTQPTWVTTSGSNTTDNTCTWQESGTSALFKSQAPLCTDAVGGGCTGAPSFPLTVAGTVISGAMPYFNSTTQESSSALLAAHGPMVGGGPATAPLTTSPGAADTIYMGNDAGVGSDPAFKAGPAGGTDGCSGSTDSPIYTASTHLWGCHQITAGASSWSSLANATTNLTLANAGWNTTINQTSATTFGLANTTAAIHLTPQQSPFLSVAGTYYTGATSAVDSWTLQDVLGTADNGTSTLTFIHTGSSGISKVSMANLSVGSGGFATASSATIGGNLSVASGANSISWTSSSKMTAPTDGSILMENSGASGFGQLRFHTDASISRLGASSFAFGNSTNGDFSATIKDSGQTIGGLFGAAINSTYAVCETAGAPTTLSTVATTTDTGLTCLPANSIIDAVVARVTTTITAACTGWELGDAATPARFSSNNTTLTSGTITDAAHIGTFNNTGIASATTGTWQASASPITITCAGGNPGAGAIRVLVFYHTPTAPTS